MQHNVNGRRKKKKEVVDNIQPHSYYNQNLQQPAANAPLLSRLRNFNNLALTSIGSFFSSPTIVKTTANLHRDEEEFSGHSTGFSCGNGLSADPNRDSGCFWLEDPQNCLSSPENDDLTVGIGFYSSETVENCSIKQLPSSRRLGTHDSLDSSDSNVFPADAGVFTRNDLPPVQRASSYYAHTMSCRRPDVRRLFGDSHCSETLDENDIRETYISAEHSIQNALKVKSAATPERATSTILCATAAVFVPSSPAARALLFRDKSSFQTNFTGLDTASVHTETPTLTPDSSETGLLSSASFSTSFDHVVPSYASCTLDSSDGIPGGFRVEGNDNDNILYTSPQLLEVKEGKKREQPPAQQTNFSDDSLRPSGSIVAIAPVLDDPEEWYGLEYTLEMSSRERQPSDTQSFSTGGEHSKSRESWAAIHRGTIHPLFEDEDYYQWKNWHRLLDKQDERRKHKKGFAFKAHSKEVAYLFVDEMRTRDVLYWQKGKYGVVAREVKERLDYITAHCPDPYFPPKKHGLGWYLKRSRSVACIRELKAIEDGTRAEKRIAAGALERKET